MAIAKIASSAGPSHAATAQKFRALAARLRARVEAVLWDPAERFFKVAGYKAPHDLAPVKELLGCVFCTISFRSRTI